MTQKPPAWLWTQDLYGSVHVQFDCLSSCYPFTPKQFIDFDDCPAGSFQSSVAALTPRFHHSCPTGTVQCFLLDFSGRRLLQINDWLFVNPASGLCWGIPVSQISRGQQCIGSSPQNASQGLHACRENKVIQTSMLRQAVNHETATPAWTVWITVKQLLDLLLVLKSNEKGLRR